VRVGTRGLRKAILLVPLVAAAAPAPPQNTVVLPPAESDAKARAVIRLSIQALGGQAYLGVRDIAASGRFAQFGHSGDVVGYAKFWRFSKPPDKERVEYFDKRNIISVWNGEQAWILDRGGVQESPPDVVQRERDNKKKDINLLFRSRMNEPGMTFTYGGIDTVDLKQVEWVEANDADRNTLRIALDRTTHFPVRSVFDSRDPVSKERVEEIALYSNYHAFQGVQTPLQVFHERNGLQVSQFFLSEVKYNNGLSDSFFTREALEERFHQLGGKKKD
jgi:outer membrane lipoprotein-sorting protein